MIADGTIVIETRGASPARSTDSPSKAGMLTTGSRAHHRDDRPGNAGIIDIEGSSALSGQIHTKGFHILGGLLRHLLHADHALAFSASLAFEQSYGGIDGDSASGAEMCCLLSALTEIPLRQDVAITGAIDQHGRIQAIGGVNEKIEGFYDAAAALGMSGAGGVIIPEANAGDLMLRPDVVEACAEGRFHVWAVSTVQEALEVFGVPAGSSTRTATTRRTRCWASLGPAPTCSGSARSPHRRPTRGPSAAARRTTELGTSHGRERARSAARPPDQRGGW